MTRIASKDDLNVVLGLECGISQEAKELWRKVEAERQAVKAAMGMGEHQKAPDWWLSGQIPTTMRTGEMGVVAANGEKGEEEVSNAKDMGGMEDAIEAIAEGLGDGQREGGATKEEGMQHEDLVLRQK